MTKPDTSTPSLARPMRELVAELGCGKITGDVCGKDSYLCPDCAPKFATASALSTPAPHPDDKMKSFEDSAIDQLRELIRWRTENNRTSVELPMQIARAVLRRVEAIATPSSEAPRPSPVESDLRPAEWLKEHVEEAIDETTGERCWNVYGSQVNLAELLRIWDKDKAFYVAEEITAKAPELAGCGESAEQEQNKVGTADIVPQTLPQSRVGSPYARYAPEQLEPNLRYGSYEKARIREAIRDIETGDMSRPLYESARLLCQVAADALDTTQPATTFVSDTSLPSCPVCGEIMRAVCGKCGVPQPAGYAYRYADGIRFNGGLCVNGSDPIESIPYYFAPPQPAQQWISVETMPTAHGEYWVWLVPHDPQPASEEPRDTVVTNFTPYARVVKTYQHPTKGIRFNCGATERPTHWMPLPEPPSFRS